MRVGHLTDPGFGVGRRGMSGMALALATVAIAAAMVCAAPPPRCDPPPRTRSGWPNRADSIGVPSPEPQAARADSVRADSASAGAVGFAPVGQATAGPGSVGTRARGGQAAPRRGLTGRRTAAWSVTLRSGLIPGWGQLVNRKPLKAVIFLAVDAWWLGNAIHYEAERSRLERTGDLDGINRAVERRNSKLWLMGATAVYAMLDAYVDSFFTDYDEGWTGRIGLDPAGRAEAALAYRF